MRFEGTGNGKWEWEMGNGNGEWEMGNGKWERGLEDNDGL